MTRILVITTAYPPDHQGGYELSCQDVVSRWRRSGHDVTVLTGQSGSPRSSDEIGVRRELVTFFRGGRFERWSLRRCLSAERHDLRVLSEALEHVEPEVVSVWHMAGIPLSLLTVVARRNLPLVGVVCDEWPGYVVDLDPWMRRWRHWRRAWPLIERLTSVPTDVPDLGRMASFCFVSHTLRDRCIKRSPWMFDRWTVTYSGIDPVDFPLDETEHSQEWSWRLVAAGRLDPAKGFATAIRALALLPSATLEIVSAAESEYRKELEALAADHGVSDRLRLSTSDRSGLRSRYLAADAVLFPSEWPEPFGLVPVEAMATGIPVIASGTGGSAEFLEHEQNCLLFEPGKERGLADAVTRMASSPELRQRLVERGRSTARLLTVDTLADQLEEWHLAAAKGFAHGVPGPPRDLRTYVRGSG